MPGPPLPSLASHHRRPTPSVFPAMLFLRTYLPSSSTSTAHRPSLASDYLSLSRSSLLTFRPNAPIPSPSSPPHYTFVFRSVCRHHLTYPPLIPSSPLHYPPSLHRTPSVAVPTFPCPRPHFPPTPPRSPSLGFPPIPSLFHPYLLSSSAAIPICLPLASLLHLITPSSFVRSVATPSLRAPSSSVLPPRPS
ncbi:hypothetical protein DFH07DRAFT_545180 [Mycena maculata]|uniref:Uncharacterized protein n=1 Tax=Mycena maculata TaxID=230809 RepID=A0AAD7N8Z4_9AGAR|nr:hypothetical protein DFH07DRAFT_545180 [Mycena maculata]